MGKKLKTAWGGLALPVWFCVSLVVVRPAFGRPGVFSCAGPVALLCRFAFSAVPACAGPPFLYVRRAPSQEPEESLTLYGCTLPGKASQ